MLSLATNLTIILAILKSKNQWSILLICIVLVYHDKLWCKYRPVSNAVFFSRLEVFQLLTKYWKFGGLLCYYGCVGVSVRIFKIDLLSCFHL